MNFVFDRWGHLLKTMNQQWIVPVDLQLLADTIHASGLPLDNYWGFIDGTVRLICRRGKDQRTLYNDHKKVQMVKFQSVVAPNGLMANLFGPVEGQCRDSSMFSDSGLFWDFQQYAHGSNNNILYLYGDPAYCF